ncbi:aspartic proteinase Asp1-like [Aristolochia californica]|uniref:aspartic proteinase Asp1-like n=1 Tax=Aristolochia californica TaxID=171875 RepID=UPI0035DA52B1
MAAKALMLVCALMLSLNFSPSCSQQQQLTGKKLPHSISSSTAIFKVNGNVYPQGMYYVIVYIGDPPKPYYLDIDTGSDLTWLQCDAPCISCTPGLPHPLYKPSKRNIVLCKDMACKTLHSQHPYPCYRDDDQCDYQIEYADHASSLGVLVRDHFLLQLANGSISRPYLALGCGYDQRSSTSGSHAPLDGVLGVGFGKSSMASQLSGHGVTRNVFAHCFGPKGGYLFFGDELIPRGVTWTPLTRNTYGHSAPGPANLILGRSSNSVKDLTVVFDSGSSYTYFSVRAYQPVVSAVAKGLSGKFKEALGDKTLPLCWTGPKQFKSVVEIKKYAKLLPLVFSFGKKQQLEIPPESYLIVSGKGNVCLGILNGTEMGLNDLNIIGDVSMQNLIVIYDNENRQIGWVPADCDRLPNAEESIFYNNGSDDESFLQGLSRPYPSRWGTCN